MSTEMRCDRCGRKPGRRLSTIGWGKVTTDWPAMRGRRAGVFDLCPDCVEVVSEALAKPRPHRSNVTPLRAVQS